MVELQNIWVEAEMIRRRAPSDDPQRKVGVRVVGVGGDDVMVRVV